MRKMLAVLSGIDDTCSEGQSVGVKEGIQIKNKGDSMFCWKCGTELPIDAEICTCCGEILSEALELRVRRKKRIRHIVIATIAICLCVVLILCWIGWAQQIRRKAIVGFWSCHTVLHDVYRLGIEGEEDYPDAEYPVYTYMDIGDDGLIVLGYSCLDEVEWRKNISAYNAAVLHADELSEEELRTVLQEGFGCNTMQELEDKVFEGHYYGWLDILYEYDGNGNLLITDQGGHDDRLTVSLEKEELTVLTADNTTGLFDVLPVVYTPDTEWGGEKTPVEITRDFIKRIDEIYYGEE